MSEPGNVKPSEVTPESVYVNRRTFLKIGIVAATTVATGAAYWYFNGLNGVRRRRPVGVPDGEDKVAALLRDPATAPATTAESTAGFTTTEAKSTYEQITTYNNFYEFTTDKDGVADLAAGFDTRNWKVAVEGLVEKPRVFDTDDILKLSRPEERIYRMRCVEGWSIVVPWVGYSLSKLLSSVAPLSSAKYVAFETLFDPARFPGQKSERVIRWPYVEGLRMDEAMHPLTLLTTGLYGKRLPPQDGAPVRLIIPWKYGFKGIKSIVKIRLVDQMPPTTWNLYAAREYGFYANVNPTVDHPRWSQATENRLGESGRRKTLMFNGYEQEVAGLYAGMDLRRNF